MLALLLMPILALMAALQSDGGGGGGTDGGGGDPTSGKDGAGNANPGGKEGDTPKPEAVKIVVEGKEYVLQDHANKLIGAARTEGRTAGRTEAETAAEAARRKLEEDALAEQGKHKDLAEARGKEIDEVLKPRLTTLESDLKAATDKLAAYETAERKRLKTAVEDLPQPVKAAFDKRFPKPDEAPPDDMSAWLDEQADVITALRGTAFKPGNGPNPRRVGPAETEIKPLVSKQQALG